MIKIFEWTDGWYAAKKGKRLAGPLSTMGEVVLDLERRGMKPFRKGHPPLTWIRGSAGPKPIRKLLKVIASVAKVVAIVKPEAAVVAVAADALGKMTIAGVKKRIASIDVIEELEALLKAEAAGRSRVGALELIRDRIKALR